MLPRAITYLLRGGDVGSGIVLAGLLGVVRYRPLALAELLRRRCLVRHVVLSVECRWSSLEVAWQFGVVWASHGLLAAAERVFLYPSVDYVIAVEQLREAASTS